MSQTPIPALVAEIAPDGKPTPRQQRKILLALSLRRQKPGTGSSKEFLQRRTAMNVWPDLRSMLEGLPWAIAGGVATRAYMPERMTQDLDILVRREDCQEAWKRFQRAGYTAAEVLDAPCFVALSTEGVEVDVICAAFPWLADALASPNVDPAGYPVLDLPYLILMKLMANRGVDIGDMTRMLGLASDEELARVRAAVQKFSPEDMEDLETIILLGKREMEESARGKWQDQL